MVDPKTFMLVRQNKMLAAEVYRLRRQYAELQQQQTGATAEQEDGAISFKEASDALLLRRLHYMASELEAAKSEAKAAEQLKVEQLAAVEAAQREKGPKQGGPRRRWRGH